MKFLKKIIAVIVIFTIIMPTSVFASENMKSEFSTKSSTKKKELVELLNKYDLEALSPEKVKELNLDKSNVPILQSSMSIDEIEKYIIKHKKQINVEPEREVNIPIDIDDDKSLLNNVLGMSSLSMDGLVTRRLSSGYSGTKIETKTLSDITNLKQDLTIKKSVAVTYKYDWVQYPGEGATISNLEIISHDQGSIEELTLGGANRLTKVNSSTCSKVSNTRIKHDYNLTYKGYMGIGVGPATIYIPLDSNTITGTTYYNLTY
ncbi:hypothetical protein SH2C18_44830 [Clostridium sediminicola]|uniref:hypothetical protein n=1 Tax=Clostridium sediminicola TaxID=3114879 RepID=UPI0031F1F812